LRIRTHWFTMQAMRPEQETTDEALAVRAAQGDDAAFSTLVHRYGRQVYRFILRYHSDRDDCDDLFQETWIRVLSHLERFNPEKRFSTWLFQIALNQCRDFGRRGQVRSNFQEASRNLKNEMSGISIEQEVDATMAMHVINKMPTPYKEVLLLRYYNGFSEAEVSEILGCPRGTVKSRLHQAIKTIRQKLDPEEEGGSR